MKMLDAIDRGTAPTIMGDGSAFDFVSVIDCAKANISAMSPKLWMNFIMLEQVSNKLEEIAEKLLKLTRSENLIQYAPEVQLHL